MTTEGEDTAAGRRTGKSKHKVHLIIRVQVCVCDPKDAKCFPCLVLFQSLQDFTGVNLLLPEVSIDTLRDVVMFNEILRDMHLFLVFSDRGAGSDELHIDIRVESLAELQALFLDIHINRVVDEVDQDIVAPWVHPVDVRSTLNVSLDLLALLLALVDGKPVHLRYDHLGLLQSLRIC